MGFSEAHDTFAPGLLRAYCPFSATLCARSSCSLLHLIVTSCHWRLLGVLVFDEVGRNPTTFRLNEHPEDTGNGIIVGSRVQGDVGIADMKRSGGGHVVKKGGKEMSIVSRLAAPFMLPWCGV